MTPDRRSDELLLSDIPDFIALPLLLKATPAEEGSERFLYMEASNEQPDFQREVVLSKALNDSAGYYLRHGNVDISHYTVLGPRSGLANFLEYEIGRPVDVRVDGATTFVKASLYRGDSPMARNADMVWSSLTRQSPPQRWYPSVGGKVLGKSVRLDPKTGDKYGVVEKVLWTNTALDRNPINHSLPEAQLVASSVFMKSLGGFVMTKALEAGYGTTPETMTGGGALRKQSLHGANGNGLIEYFALRDRLSDDIRVHRFGARAMDPSRDEVIAWLKGEYGLDDEQAAATVERFVRDLQERRQRRAQ